MGNEIKILIVENSPEDLKLILGQLNKDNILYSYLNIETKENFIKALTEYSPDIVLTGYSMPAFDGLTIINLIKDLSPLTPVIIVTGSINEDTAVECMKMGADDYVLTNNITRLGYAIKGALENKSLRIEKELGEKKILKLNRTYAVIGQINEMIVRVRDREKLFEEACKIAVETGKYRLVWVGLVDDKDKVILPHIWNGNEDGFLEEIKKMSPEEILRNDPVQNRILMGSYFLCNNIMEEDSGFILRKNGLAHGFHSLISLPLTLQTKVIGSFNIYDDEPDFFNEDEIKLLLEIAGDLSYSIETIANEKAITISELRYRRLFESAKDGIIILNADNGEIVDVNPFITTNLDYLKEDMIGKQLWEIGFLKDSIFNKDSFLELLEHEYIRYEDLPLRKKDGTSMDVEFVSNVYLVDNVKVIQCNIRDITSRKITEKKLLKLSRAVEHGPASVVITNREGDIEYVNKKFTEISGYSKEEVIGKNPRLLSSGYHDKKFYEELWNTLLAGNNWNGEILNKKKDGELYWESALISPLIENNKDIISFVAVKEDITSRKKMISELIESKEMAESANKLKDAFIANISHEIRTPLSGILGMASLIRDMFPVEIKKEDEELFSGIDYSSQRLLRTVDLILNYSRLQVGDFPLFQKNILLSSVCQKLIREYETETKNKLIELTFQNNCGDANIFADEYSITMAISNLLSNAVKYTNEGFIYLILRKDNNENIILDVKDTGIGISEEYLNNIFEPYRQEQMGYSREYDGIGLGLALVKKLLSINHVRVSVESKKGEGTTFSVDFGKVVNPVDIKAHNGGIAFFPSFEEKSRKALVLIVEDDAINQLTMQKFLEDRYNSIIADSAEKAMGVLKNHKVDLIFMDISIKGEKDGLELTKYLKASKKYSHIPIVAATAHVFIEDKQKALASGCDNFLAKPFSKKEILDMAEVYLNIRK